MQLISGTKLVNVCDKLLPSYLRFLDLATPLSPSASDKAEYLPLVMQFSPRLPSQNHAEKVQIVTRNGNSFICMLGLNCFGHLLTLDPVRNSLQALIDGEFHFMKHVKKDDAPFITAQCQVAAFKSRLFTTNPLANQAYLPYYSNNYRNANQAAAVKVDNIIESAGIKYLNRKGGVNLKDDDKKE